MLVSKTDGSEYIPSHNFVKLHFLGQTFIFLSPKGTKESEGQNNKN